MMTYIHKIIPIVNNTNKNEQDIKQPKNTETATHNRKRHDNIRRNIPSPKILDRLKIQDKTREY